MNIHEYQAKEIFRKFGIPVPMGVVVYSSDEVEAAAKAKKIKSDTLVVKAQIHAGGRGKAGGVKVVKSAAEAAKVVQSMMGSTLVTHQTGPAGQMVRRVYIEEASSIKKEYYIGAVIDRKLSRISFIFSSEGGVDIEEVAKNSPEKIINFTVDPACGFQAFQGRKIGFGMQLSSEQVKKVTGIVQKMYEIFVATDASQVEINPLVETATGDFIALDAKMNFDDNAMYRHPEISELRDYDEEVSEEVEASKYGLNYIKMDGVIGCMVNGAGLAMATMDIIKYYGSSPANFLDVGGGATRETVTEAFKIILSDKKVEGILVNIFGGIMRCDIIAGGIIEAAHDVSIKVPLVVRLSGTNADIGKEMLTNSGLNIVAADDLDDAAQKIVNLVKA